jgi:multidrug transporter EmrE-like cation transporter
MDKRLYLTPRRGGLRGKSVSGLETILADIDIPLAYSIWKSYGFAGLGPPKTFAGQNPTSKMRFRGIVALLVELSRFSS